MRVGGGDGIEANAPQMSITRGCLRALSRKTSRRKRCMLRSSVFIVKDRSAAKRYAAEVNAPRVDLPVNGRAVLDRFERRKFAHPFVNLSRGEKREAIFCSGGSPRTGARSCRRE